MPLGKSKIEIMAQKIFHSFGHVHICEDQERGLRQHGIGGEYVGFHSLELLLSASLVLEPGPKDKTHCHYFTTYSTIVPVCLC